MTLNNQVELIHNGAVVSTFQHIQDAINAASDGDTISIGAGTYDEAVTIDKGVTILGPNSGLAGDSGLRGPEAIVTGTVTVTSATAVHIDGLEFADRTPWQNGAAAAADLRTELSINTFADHVVENSIFVRDPANDGNPSDAFAGFGSAQGHRALYISGGNDGSLTISGNLFTGTNTTYNYDGDVFRSHIWSDGGGTGTTTISDNVFEHGRTAINADGFAGNTVISGNSFDHVGSAVSVGAAPGMGSVDSIHDNDFTNVDTEFNFQNIATSVHFDAAATGNEATLPTDPVLILGGSAGDSLGGSAGNDLIDGRAGDDTIDGGTGADTMTGGDGNDVFVVDNLGDSINEASGAGSGTDEVRVAVDNYTLAGNVENLTLLEGQVGTRIDFHDYAPGTIADGEQGWKEVSPASPAQAVVDLGGAHGRVWQVANDPTAGDFGGPYSPGLAATAGESGTTADFSTMTYSLQFKAVSGVADGSRLEIDFANSGGTDRENFLFLEWTNGGSGLRLGVNEPLASVSGDWTSNSFDFATGNRSLATGIDPSQWHELDVRAVFNPGPNNDVIGVYLDGRLVGTTTSFENFRDFHLGQAHAAAAEDNQVAGLLFRAGEPAGNPFPADGAGGNRQGFYIDDLGYGVGTAPVTAAGNALANLITGNSVGNHLDGAGGDDTIDGAGGDDTLVGGAGADSLIGGVGTDTADYSGSALAVSVNLTTGLGSGGDAQGDHLTGIENLIGSGGNDVLTGDSAENVLAGGDGNDTIAGGNGADQLFGGAGNDLFTDLGAGGVADVVSAGAGIDTLQSFLSRILLADEENLTLLGATDVYGVGNALDNHLIGNAGNNILMGLDGNDTIEGGVGINQLIGGNGNDTFDNVDAGDFVTAGAGIDTINAGMSWTLDSDEENLVLLGTGNIDGAGNALANSITGNAGNNILTGLGGNDGLSGGAGNDMLSGGDGNDALDGGAGVNQLIGGNGDDTFNNVDAGDIVTAGTGVDRVNASVSWTLDSDEEILALQGTGNINGTGNAFANTLVGNAGNNILTGLDGNDALLGGAGNDALLGGAGNDTLLGGLGNDTLTGGAGMDILDGSDGQDVFKFSALSDSGMAAAARDVISGFAHGDKIDLSDIDANGGIGGNQAFTFHTDFTHHAGEVQVDQLSANSFLVSADVNGDAVADFGFSVTTLAGFGTLHSSDFIL